MTARAMSEKQKTALLRIIPSAEVLKLDEVVAAVSTISASEAACSLSVSEAAAKPARKRTKTSSSPISKTCEHAYQTLDIKVTPDHVGWNRSLVYCPD
jgi:hypothetical protein